jgi:hypothetical protein
MTPQTAKATVDLSRDDDNVWLHIEHNGKKAAIALDNHGPGVNETVRGWAETHLQPSRRESAMKRLIAFATGALALVVVAGAAGSAITYAVMHGAQTLSLLGNSALSGIGMAIGGCLGSAVVLRFKTARRYVHHLLHDINERHAP